MTDTSAPKVPVTDFPYEERRARLIYDALRFNAESLRSSYARLSSKYREIYDRGYDSRGVKVEYDELTLMFSDAWSVLRSYNSIFEIVRKERVLEIEIGENDKNIGFVASKIRAKFDHIATNLGNFAKRKNEAMHPMLGILTACFIPKFEWGASVDELHSVVLSHSDFHHKLKLEAFPQENELFPFSGRISHIRLHAFEYTASLSKMDDFGRRLINALDVGKVFTITDRLNLVVSMKGQAPFHIDWNEEIT